jgi:hypothetical protein
MQCKTRLGSTDCSRIQTRPGAVQDRTGQDRTGQDRTGQDRTGQDRTGKLLKLGSKNLRRPGSIVYFSFFWLVSVGFGLPKRRKLLFRYRSESTKVLFRIVPKLVLVPVLVFEIEDSFEGHSSLKLIKAKSGIKGSL